MLNVKMITKVGIALNKSKKNLNPILMDNDILKNFYSQIFFDFNK